MNAANLSQWAVRAGMALLVMVVAIGCGEEEEETPEADCGQGVVIEADGEVYCAYGSAITEEGFTCPEEFSMGSTYGDIVLCGPSDQPPQAILDVVLNEFTAGLPTNTCQQTTCGLDQTCTAGSCEDRECWSDSDCPPSGECNLGLCDVDEEPAGEDRVLLLLSQRVSWQCTDSGNGRLSIASALQDLISSESASVGMVAYSTWARPWAFGMTQEDLQGPFDSASGLGPASDLQGALSVAAQILADDSDDDHQYHLVIVDTSIPEPQCNEGCDNDPNYGMCDADDIPEGEYVDFDGPCTAYNQPDTLTQRFQDAVDAVENLRVYVALLSDTPEDIESLCGDLTDFGTDEALNLYQPILDGLDVDTTIVQEIPTEFDFAEFLSMTGE